MKNLFQFALIGLISISFASCGGSNMESTSSENSEVSVEETTVEETVAVESDTVSTEVESEDYAQTAPYVCPMHCEGSGSEEAGTCPVCHMVYVENGTEDMNHDHEDHEGHQH